VWYSFIYTPTLPARLLHKARAARLLRPGGAAKAHAQSRQRRPPRPAPDVAARARRAQVRRRAAGRHQPVPGPLPAAAGRARAVGPGHRPLPALGCAGRLRLGSGLGDARALHRTRPPWHPEAEPAAGAEYVVTACVHGARGDTAVATTRAAAPVVAAGRAWRAALPPRAAASTLATLARAQA